VLAAVLKQIEYSAKVHGCTFASFLKVTHDKALIREDGVVCDVQSDSTWMYFNADSSLLFSNDFFLKK
jgi:hypothetical protein